MVVKLKSRILEFQVTWILGDSNCMSYSHCRNWSLRVSQLPSSVNFQKWVQWISKNVSKCFIISSDSSSDDNMIISHYYEHWFLLHPYIDKNLNRRLFVAAKELQECDSKFLAFYRMKEDGVSVATMTHFCTFVTVTSVLIIDFGWFFVNPLWCKFQAHCLTLTLLERSEMWKHFFCVMVANHKPQWHTLLPRWHTFKKQPPKNFLAKRFCTSDKTATFLVLFRFPFTMIIYRK